MFTLPAISFAVLATLVLYASVRGYRYFFPSALASSKSGSLPAPVVGKSSTWSFPKWPRRLSVSGIPRVRVRVPWSRSSSLDSSVVPKTKNSKKLGIELLPTTGLPPRPSALPTPPAASSSHVLVDVSESSGTAFTPSTSAPSTPRAPTPPFATPAPSGGYFSNAKALLLPLHNHSRPRPPSPHALLATTTPPRMHKRSRSLGGVPVRRLSTGAGSALRHALDTDMDRDAVEMDDLGVRNGHVRDTSREHLLIDFSSSSSSGHGKGGLADDPDISPAASDIGVLPLNTTAPLRTRSDSAYGYGHEVTAPQPISNTPIAVLPKQVARQVPLVDLEPEEEEESSWKWFNEAPVVASAMIPSPAAAREMKHVGEVKMEKLVDVDEPVALKPSEPVSEATLIDVEERNYSEGMLIDVSDKPAPTVFQVSSAMTSRVVLAPSPVDVQLDIMTAPESVPLPEQSSDELLEDPFADPPPSLSLADDPFADPHPVLAPPIYELPSPQQLESSPVSAEVNQQSSDVVPPVSVESPPEVWSWEVHHDPWHDHIADVEALCDVAAPPTQEYEMVSETTEATQVEEEEVSGLESPIGGDVLPAEEVPLEHSPAGVLAPTVVDDEEDEDEPIPSLDLNVAVQEKSVALLPSESMMQGDEAASAEEVEEETTPKATPSSTTQELPPPWSPLEALPIDDYDYHAQDEADESSDVEPVPTFVSSERSEYDDPELLELPSSEEPVLAVYVHEETPVYGPTPEEISFVLSNPGGALFTVEKPSDDAHLERREDEQHTPTKATPLAQTPTPPASPPPMNHGLSLSTRIALKSSSNHNSRAVSPVAISLASSLTAEKLDLGAEELKEVKSSASAKDVFGEDKENVAPRPAWSIRAQDAPALGVPSAGYILGSSPRAIKKAISSESNKENSPVSVQQSKQESEAPESAVEAPVEPAVKVVVASIADDAPAASPAPLLQVEQSDSLPGALPEPAIISKVEVTEPSTSRDDTPASPTSASSTAVSTTATSAVTTRRRALTGVFASTIPSVRRIVRSPLDVALAMQLRPGLGAGADPAWMVRFLMAMYGWLAVVIAGQDF